jgi:hypothetical protein
VTQARAALLFLISAAGMLPFLPARTAGETVGPSSPPRHGQVLLFVVDRVSFEELLRVGQFRALAGTGGVALMATKAGPDRRELDSYAILGAGTRSDAPGDGHLMSRILGRWGVTICRALDPTLPGRYNFEDLSALSPSLAPCRSPLPADAVVVAAAGTLQVDQAARAQARDLPAQREKELRRAGEALVNVLSTLSSPRIEVVEVTPLPSFEMDRRGDEVTPLVVARTSPRQMPPGPGPRSLRSDTTRRTGLVSNVDVAPTILSFFGIPIPSEMDGSPVVTTDAAPPFALHRLHLEQRRIRLPLQLGEVAYVVGLGIIGIAALIALALRGSLPRRFAAFMRFATLVGVAEGVTLLAGGLLPRLTYAWVVPFVAITMIVLAALSFTARNRGPLGPFAFLAAVTLGFVLLDGALGGAAFRSPLLGGTMFDGVRFYGLPNSFIALPLAGALILAIRLDPFRGFLLLLGVGLFCGFPGLGANVGASITLFAAAGLWWVIRTRPRFGLREVAFVAGVVALGLAAVLLANRLAPGTPTHAARFVERAGSGWERALTDLRHRLGIGVKQLLDAPPAFIPVVGLAVVFALAVRPIGPIRRGLGLVDEPWRQMIVVMSLSSLIAFAANDTGVAAAAPGFMYALTGLAYPAYLDAAARPNVALNGHRIVQPSQTGLT